ncbi:uncharacterized protein ColSpa_09782 [Colletotrichum spaethianum]|uniref:Uncharacterized protein n=1 Tax=Colletotrichum spaethianum TaxID=700344 RepID=A0AA37PCC7_9PEZI|nr:uncharacterized protein ColSpa_09782 [Colletotrichum spaethianum]GKT49601.1 hypothetical protein ColSpa_09782 [Colletotrichum spaethianum]
MKRESEDNGIHKLPSRRFAKLLEIVFCRLNSFLPLTYKFTDFCGSGALMLSSNNISDLVTGVSANTSCSGTDVTATVGFPRGQASIQDWAPYVYVPGTDKTYTTNISTNNPIYTCGHTGTPGVAAKCFNEYGTFGATNV